MEKFELIYDLEKVVLELNRLIAHVGNKATSMNIDEYTLMDPTGQLVLAPLLVAKANALSAIAGLHTIK